MNIFAYDPDPRVCASWLDDVRLNKMITEHAQMFTAMLDYRKPQWFSQYYDHRVGYPISVMSHPCTRWLISSWGNARWLRDMTHEMLTLWGKRHASGRIMLPVDLACEQFGLGEEQTPFANAARSVAMNLDFTHVNDTHLAYRMYHIERWNRDKPKPTWRKGTRPPWKLD